MSRLHEQLGKSAGHRPSHPERLQPANLQPSERGKGYLSPVTAPGWAAVPQHGGVEHANTVTGSKATISLRSVAHFESLATVCGVKSLCGISARSIG
jgi:hypothetical protein